MVKTSIVTGLSVCLLLALALLISGNARAADPEPFLFWGGACYNSQVGATGLISFTKTISGSVYAVKMDGILAINSPTYGYVRHELPPGFRPDSTDRSLYTCEIAVQGGEQRTVSVAAPGTTESADQPYENGMILFPDKFYNGIYKLLCRWQTQETDPDIEVYRSCYSLKHARDLPTPTSTPAPIVTTQAAPTETPPFIPTAPPATATFVPTAPAQTNMIYLAQAHARLCLPGSCN